MVNWTWRPRDHRRGIFRGLVAVVAVGTLTTAGLAWAGHHGMGPFGGGHGRFGGRFARLHVELVADRALRVAEATPEQREKVQAILEKAFADHARFHTQHTALRTDALAILTADTVDRGQLEELRAKHLRLAEQGSRHFTAVLGDIAETLTPEQRQKLAAHARQMFE